MQTTTYAHFDENDRYVCCKVKAQPNGDRYLVLSLGSATGASVELFFHDTDTLDRLANEIERATREWVGDVPTPSQEYLDGLGELQSREALR